MLEADEVELELTPADGSSVTEVHSAVEKAKKSIKEVILENSHLLEVGMGRMYRNPNIRSTS